MFQLGTERFHASVRYEILHRLIDESAALAGSGHAVNGLDRCFR